MKVTRELKEASIKVFVVYRFLIVFLLVFADEPRVEME